MLMPEKILLLYDSSPYEADTILSQSTEMSAERPKLSPAERVHFSLGNGSWMKLSGEKNVAL